MVFSGAVYDPKFSMLLRSTVKLTLNIPPENCRILITPSKGIELNEEFTINVLDCRDYELPMLYRFSIYLNNHDLTKDKLAG
jgi:hypothetical protein